jgi:dihydrolipoamide dehydrogenase
MEVDVAVLGGGPGGYTAAIRAAQLGARVACVDREPELGGTCLRIGCIPTKAWVQTAFALKEAEHTFDKLGVKLGGFQLEFGKANEWKDGVVKQMTDGVAFLFKANGVEWVKGTGTFKDAHTIAVEGGEDVTFKHAIVATGSFPLRPPIEGLDSKRCVDSEGLLAQTEVPKRLVVLGGGIIGCEFASIFRRFGSEVTIVEMLDSLIPQEDADASKELAKQFKKRNISLQLGKQCTKVEDDGSQITVHFGEGETVQADLMLVSVGRGPLVEGIGLERAGVEYDRRTGVATDEHRRTTRGHGRLALGLGRRRCEIGLRPRRLRIGRTVGDGLETLLARRRAPPRGSWAGCGLGRGGLRPVRAARRLAPGRGGNRLGDGF